jgi:hypothetical protein
MPSTPPSPISITCPRCGLPNIPERQTCKRCQSPLTPTDQERQLITTMARHNRASWLRLLPVFLIWAICGGAFMFKVFNNEPWMPKPGGVIDIRANGVAILRMATKTPPEDVQIYSNPTRFVKFFFGASSRNSRFALTRFYKPNRIAI